LQKLKNARNISGGDRILKLTLKTIYRQWTGAQRSFFGAVRIDGSVYRFMGGSDGVISTPMQQISVQVLPTRTIYNFAANGINLNVEFMSPLLPDDYEILSRPVSYITFSAKSSKYLYNIFFNDRNIASGKDSHFDDD
jgi:hypothetical protein